LEQIKVLDFGIQIDLQFSWDPFVESIWTRLCGHVLCLCHITGDNTWTIGNCKRPFGTRSLLGPLPSKMMFPFTITMPDWYWEAEDERALVDVDSQSPG
jgi:hypothetical protein